MLPSKITNSYRLVGNIVHLQVSNNKALCKLTISVSWTRLPGFSSCCFFFSNQAEPRPGPTPMLYGRTICPPVGCCHQECVRLSQAWMPHETVFIPHRWLPSSTPSHEIWTSDLIVLKPTQTNWPKTHGLRVKMTVKSREDAKHSYCSFPYRLARLY